MPKECMRRMASDNEYLHKDFHLALNNGIMYLENRYGEEAVREYLTAFAADFYKPLINDIAKHGLAAIKAHYEKIYETEKAEIKTELKEDSLSINIFKCPAIEHIKRKGDKPADSYVETTKTVNMTICRNTDYEFELISYEPETGAASMKFYRRIK